MHKKLIGTFIICMVLILSVYAQQHSPKRGLAYGYHSAGDMAALAPGVSWWYNWDVSPETSVLEVYETLGFDFVPMVWNHLFDETEMRNFLDQHEGTEYILGFNEPNFLAQANMTPSEAAAQWPIIEAIADEYDLKIVGPAVNYCGSCVEENGVIYNDPFQYLDDFFAACPDCRVDYIAVHCYMNTVGALSWYIGEFKKYGKPIWLTEFAGWESNGNINSPDDQINFLIGAVDYLENDPDVFRYSWFIGRGNGASTYPYIDILGGDGELTELGEIYVNMPLHDTDNYHVLPGRIEAEDYNRMQGILLELTQDENGFINVGYIDPGDWLEYNVNIEVENDYYMVFRIASTSSSTLAISLDGVNQLNQTFDNTHGWQNWQSFYSPVNLDAGMHKLRLTAQTAGFNINWIELTTEEPEKITQILESNAISCYPNPVTSTLHIDSDFPLDYIEVSDVLGHQIKRIRFINALDISELPSGVYFIRLLKMDSKVFHTFQILVP
jgi:hypothetical protein